MTAPANKALQWKLHEFNFGDGDEGPYSGYPRPELEEAWEGLLGSKLFLKSNIYSRYLGFMFCRDECSLLSRRLIVPLDLVRFQRTRPCYSSIFLAMLNWGIERVIFSWAFMLANALPGAPAVLRGHNRGFHYPIGGEKQMGKKGLRKSDRILL